jgi:SpoIID/LytB domain protein
MKWRYILVPVILLSVFVGLSRQTSLVKAEESCGDNIECFQKQINDLTALLNTNQGEANKIGTKIKSIQSQINVATAKLKVTEANIKDRSKKVSTQYLVLSVKIREMYMRLRSQPLWVSLLSSTSMGEARRELAYRQDSNERDKQIIVNLVQEIGSLEADKKALELKKIQLAKLQADLDVQNPVFLKEIKTLSAKIAKITAEMQEVINSKIDSLNLSSSLGGGPLYCVDDRKLDPGFGAGFAFFTSGIPHRVGMSQYGAQLRAKKGQSYETILRAYYDNISIEKADENTEILVNGTNDYRQTFNNERMKIEDYMKHVYEMPGDWEMDALKAQAIAARSYALAVMRDEKVIKPNQEGQEIKKEENTQKWKDAVEQTKGMVLRSEGQIAKAWYASTAGGYTYRSSDVWQRSTSWTKRLRDTEGDVGSLNDLFSKAYDRESPCLYTAQGSRKEYAKSAWLKPEEVADIANVILLVRRDPSIDRYTLCGENSPNKKCHDFLSTDSVKTKLRNAGGHPFDYISEATITGFDFGIGKSNGIRLRDRGGREEAFDGDEFKNFFNTRAPSNIVIVGPLYNVERR